MQFITVTENVDFQNPVYGSGSLVKGKTYYTFGQFARETADRGFATLARNGSPSVLHFRPSHLGMETPPKRILVLFAGGHGDAITAGLVLPLAAKRHGFSFDLCCAKRKWEEIFRPMGIAGRHVPYPPDLETLAPYDAVLSDMTDFYPSRDGLRNCPVLELLQGFHVETMEPTPSYDIPPEVRMRWKLAPSAHPRVGVNLDSQGRVKSYPARLEDSLLRALQAGGAEAFLLGSRGYRGEGTGIPGVSDLRGKTSIPELAAVLEQMDAVLAVDSFVAHLANLLSRKTLVLLSSTSPASFGWHRHISCMSSRVECSPCFSLFHDCGRGYPACRAFYHESMNPEVITRSLMERLEAG